ncbi:hypothetical protein FGO68_gene1571 [Halteria grandinella]|uniref:Uncharacterized protein n=1 Tax=Halteria grandinella TaxID=5974 RepID=A0A8J8NLQ3_HALGN|nr:hypothetical protein FGO68_gene1571 [Halteria grandinella]
MRIRNTLKYRLPLNMPKMFITLFAVVWTYHLANQQPYAKLQKNSSHKPSIWQCQVQIERANQYPNIFDFLFNQIFLKGLYSSKHQRGVASKAIVYSNLGQQIQSTRKLLIFSYPKVALAIEIQSLNMQNFDCLQQMDKTPCEKLTINVAEIMITKQNSQMSSSQQIKLILVLQWFRYQEAFHFQKQEMVLIQNFCQF